MNGGETTAVATTTKEWIVCSLHKTESCAYSRNLGHLSEIRELTLEPNISSSQSSGELPCLWNHPYLTRKDSLLQHMSYGLHADSETLRHFLKTKQS